MARKGQQKHVQINIQPQIKARIHLKINKKLLEGEKEHLKT